MPTPLPSTKRQAMSTKQMETYNRLPDEERTELHGKELKGFLAYLDHIGDNVDERPSWATFWQAEAARKAEANHKADRKAKGATLNYYTRQRLGKDLCETWDTLPPTVQEQWVSMPDSIIKAFLEREIADHDSPDRKPKRKLDAVQQPTDHGPPEPEPNDYTPTEQERAEYHRLIQQEIKEITESHDALGSANSDHGPPPHYFLFDFLDDNPDAIPTEPDDHGPAEQKRIAAFAAEMNDLPDDYDPNPTEQEIAEYHAESNAESDADSQKRKPKPKPKPKRKRKPLQALQELELPVHIYDVDEIEEIKATLIAASDEKQAALDNGQQPPPLPISPPTTDDILTPLTAALASADNPDAILAALAALAWAEIKGFPAECPIPTESALRHYCPIQRKGQPVSLEEIQEDWKQRKPRPEHPLLALVANWQMIYFGERLFPQHTEPFFIKKKGTLPAFPEWQALFSQCLHAGRSASWELRLLVGVFLHLHIKHRDGQWRVLRFSTEDVIAWLFPHGWTNKKRDWHQLPAALERLNALGWLHIPGLGSVRLIEATIIPRQPTDPFVEFVVRLPKGNAKGGGIDWPTLSEYGQHSASLYRSYLVAISEMHRSAHNGQPQTRLIGKPVLDKEGKPKRRKGGKVQRSKDELIPNPGAQYVRGLTAEQVTEMAGLDPKDKHHRLRTRKAFLELHTKGVIDLAQDGKVWRIFGPPIS